MESLAKTQSAPGQQPPSRWRPVIPGAIQGVFAALAIHRLGLSNLPALGWTDHYLLMATLFGSASLFRLRKAIPWVTGALASAFLVIGYSPLMPWLMQGLTEPEPEGTAPAVVVLAATVRPGDALSGDSLARITRGYELLGANPNLTLILTRVPAEMLPWCKFVRGQMKALNLTNPIEEVGEVRTTHDEAVEAAKLCKAKGWERVYLVTHAWHMKRAAAVFRKAGVEVLPRACKEETFDAVTLPPGGDRVEAFRRWLHEVVGLWAYRRRGWV